MNSAGLSSTDFDLIVVGLGAMGAATLMHAARAGYRVLGIDRHDPPHTFGSSHAETRISRLGVGEGPEYQPFVARTHDIWRQLERETGQNLFHQNGGYTIAPPATFTPGEDQRWADFVNQNAQIAAAAGVDYEIMDAAELTRRQPMLVPATDAVVGFEPTAGVVMIERCISVQLELARAAGAHIVVNDPVTALEPDAGGCTVRTGSMTARGAKVVLSTGPWIADLAPTLANHTEVLRQTVAWFEVEDPEAFTIDNFSYVMWTAETVEDYVALWPSAPGTGPGLKVMRERFDEPCHPDTVNRLVSDAEVAELFERFVDGRVRGVQPHALRTAMCLYTNTPDEAFIVDHHPDSTNVIVASPCSGHGFKHSSALGEAMAQWALGAGPTLDLSPFSLNRF